jgi:sec-independent protein translocase protein TatA
MMGSGEILVIMIVILILFGGKRLPEFAKSLGKGIREFKKATQGDEEIIEVIDETSHPSTNKTESSPEK